jgi:hypothetical protein
MSSKAMVRRNRASDRRFNNSLREVLHLRVVRARDAQVADLGERQVARVVVVRVRGRGRARDVATRRLPRWRDGRPSDTRRVAIRFAKCRCRVAIRFAECRVAIRFAKCRCRVAIRFAKCFTCALSVLVTLRSPTSETLSRQALGTTRTQPVCHCGGFPSTAGETRRPSSCHGPCVKFRENSRADARWRCKRPCTI